MELQAKNNEITILVQYINKKGGPDGGVNKAPDLGGSFRNVG